MTKRCEPCDLCKGPRQSPLKLKLLCRKFLVCRDCHEEMRAGLSHEIRRALHATPPYRQGPLMVVRETSPLYEVFA